MSDKTGSCLSVKILTTVILGPTTTTTGLVIE